MDKRIEANLKELERHYGYSIGYMDKIEFDHELGNAPLGNKVYPSIEALQADKRCVGECGIVTVKVELLSVVEETKSFAKTPGKRFVLSRRSIVTGQREEIVGAWDEAGKFVADDPQPEYKPHLGLRGTFKDVSPEDQKILLELAAKYGVEAKTSSHKLT